MINTQAIIKFERLANFAGLVGIVVVLGMTLGVQFVLYDLPCPLCLLQRLGFLGMALGFILNLRYGFRPSHYSVVLTSGLLCAFIALRQIALHVIPGTGVYGSSIFGWHLYTWSFVISVAAIIITSILLGADRQYQVTEEVSEAWKKLTNIMFAILLLILSINVVAIFLQCGFQACESDPVRYELLSH